jgi:hypothetical protein
MAAAVCFSLQRCCCLDKGTRGKHQLAQPLMPSKTEDGAKPTTAHEPILPPEKAGCLRMFYERLPTTSRARLRISVVREPITDDAIELLLSYSLRAVEFGEPFSVLWDLRECSLPKTSQVGVGTCG